MLSRVVLDVATRTRITWNPVNFINQSSPSSSNFKLLMQKCVSQSLWSQDEARSSFLLDLYLAETGAVYLKLAEKSEGRKGEIFVDCRDFSKFSAGLKNVYESGFASKEFISLGENHECQFFHLGNEIKIRRRGDRNSESGLVFLSVGEVEEIVNTIREFEAVGLERVS